MKNKDYTHDVYIRENRRERKRFVVVDEEYNMYIVQ